MQVNKRRALAMSGLLWAAVGAFLLMKGIFYFLDLAASAFYEGSQISFLTQKLTEQTKDLRQSIAILIGLAFLIGSFKGLFVFKKTVSRLVGRIESQQAGLFVPLTQVYPKGYLFLLAGMMGLGAILKRAPLSFDIKGLIDVSIGFALLFGSTFYFRAALRKRAPA